MLAITAGLLAHAGAAGAATLNASYDAYSHFLPSPYATYTYLGSPGERNDLTIRFNTGIGIGVPLWTSVQVDVFGESGALIFGPNGGVTDPEIPSYVPGVLCVSPSILVVCNAHTFATFVNADLGDGNDRGKVDDGGRRTPGYPGALWVSWEGGSGNDTTGGGSAGEEAVRQDTLAGPGADTVLSGGAMYQSRATSQSLTLDGVANDGDPGEKDNLSQTLVRLIDGDGNSTLVGSDFAQSQFYGNGGADQMNPKGGADKVDGGAGDDTITLSPDGAKDTISCGAGSDTVQRVGGVDALDVISADCENVV